MGARFPDKTVFHTPLTRLAAAAKSRPTAPFEHGGVSVSRDCSQQTALVIIHTSCIDVVDHPEHTSLREDYPTIDRFDLPLPHRTRSGRLNLYTPFPACHTYVSAFRGPALCRLFSLTCCLILPRVLSGSTPCVVCFTPCVVCSTSRVVCFTLCVVCSTSFVVCSTSCVVCFEPCVVCFTSCVVWFHPVCCLFYTMCCLFRIMFCLFHPMCCLFHTVCCLFRVMCCLFHTMCCLFHTMC